MKSLRLIILLVIAAVIFGIYGHKTYQFKQDVKQQRAERSMEFLEKLHIYDDPEIECIRETQQALDAKDFAKLDTLAETYAAEQYLPEKNRGHIRRFFWVVAEEGGEKSRKDRLETLTKWQEANPKSAPAKVAYARAMIRYAWDARGDGFANTVTREKSEVFHSRLKKAVEVLKTLTEKQLIRYPEGFACILTCARGLGIPDDKFNSLYQESVKLAPLSLRLHFTAAHFTTVQWGGKPGEWEANLKTAIKDLPKDKVDQVYAATIYMMVNRGHFFSKAYNEVFKPAKIDSDRIIHGLKLIIAAAPEKSPYSIYYRNALAHAVMEFENNPIACRDALQSADWQIALGIWGSEENFDYYCREWLDRRFKAYNTDIDEYESANSPLRFFSLGD